MEMLLMNGHLKRISHMIKRLVAEKPILLHEEFAPYGYLKAMM